MTALADALASEQQLAERAAEIRADATALSRELFLALQPLLRTPIPAAFISTTPAVKGKPYPSTGVKSVQVCIDRMDNVLTPLAWGIYDDYASDGRLCYVTIAVHDGSGETLASRSSWGGVNQASTEGNLRKGSFTNAAKRAFGMLGVGHEIYLGASDHDPDTDTDAAKAQGRAPRRGAHARAAPPDEELAALLLQQDGLTDLRGEVHRGFEALGMPAGQRLRELQQATTRDQLESLRTRIGNALDGAS